MKQLVQNFRSGETSLEENPVPRAKAGCLLVKTYCSLVSLGTEKMLVSFGQSNLIDKARSQPDKVRQVVSKVKTDGIISTYSTVKSKLDTPIPLGYSAVGEVISVGEGDSEFSIGDRVVTNGPHAEVVSVPFNLAAKIPDQVSYEEAAFTVISSIGLQGIRLADPKFGESVVVVGLGLIGLLTAQLLVASGCNVIGVDLDQEKVSLAQKFGVNAVNSGLSDPVKAVLDITKGVGADCVIITASTKSNDVIRQSAEMSRVRGKIILVGVVGLDIDRSTFYHKELSFQVSCSYGPGRYDPVYEQEGVDYPLPYVRWTEKRNFQAVLDALMNKKLLVNDLVSETILIKDFDKLYSEIGRSKSIATILKYEFHEKEFLKPGQNTVAITPSYSQSKGKLAVVGSGNFARATLLPSLAKLGADIKYLVSSEGLSSTTLAKKFAIEYSSTDFESVLEDTDISAVVVSTRPHMHAMMAVKSLKAGKHVFVEKPLGLTQQEVEDVKEALKASGKSLYVGFNRRFSPHIIRTKELIGDNPGQLSVVATMNAGFIPLDSWIHDPKVGGGRIIGEACHYIDLISYIANSPVLEVCMQGLGSNPDSSVDCANILIKLENGSMGVINYLANGNTSYPKERIEIFSQGRNLVIDNFCKLYAFGIGSKKLLASNVILKTRLDKGHREQFKRYLNFLQNGGEPLIPFENLENVTAASICAIQSLKEKKWISV